MLTLEVLSKLNAEIRSKQIGYGNILPKVFRKHNRNGLETGTPHRMVRDA